MSKSSLVPAMVRNALNQARFSFTRNGVKTVFVEGLNDRKMIEPMINKDTRLEILHGKDNVMSVNGLYARDNFARQKGYVMLMADVDYDIIINRGTSNDVTYNVVCSQSGHVYNDLETYLVNTPALKKVMCNYNIFLVDQEIKELAESLELVSRFFGKYRAADESLKYKLGGQSILNGFSIEQFFTVTPSLSFDEGKFLENLPLWANRKELVDDLIEEANKINNRHSKPWSLSNGHDITHTLSTYISEKESSRVSRKITIKAEDVEKLLRLACDHHEYKSSPMGRALEAFGAL